MTTEQIAKLEAGIASARESSDVWERCHKERCVELLAAQAEVSRLRGVEQRVDAGSTASVVYRDSPWLRITLDDYNEAIAELQEAKSQLEPDGSCCAVCGDSGHQAWECHHNPLAMAREAAKMRSQWRCFHCGEVFIDAKLAAEHFGNRGDEEPAACGRMLQAMWEAFEQYGVHRNFHNAASVKILADGVRSQLSHLTEEATKAVASTPGAEHLGPYNDALKAFHGLLEWYRLELAAARRERDEARWWIQAANQFAWAHERTCPRHDADAVCDCGLDDFLSRPRPFVESYKAIIQRLTVVLHEAERLRKIAYDDGMIAHHWFTEAFGEQMNGRDFAVKIPIAQAELSALRLRLDAYEKPTPQAVEINPDKYACNNSMCALIGVHTVSCLASRAAIDAAKEKA